MEVGRVCDARGEGCHRRPHRVWPRCCRWKSVRRQRLPTGAATAESSSGLSTGSFGPIGVTSWVVASGSRGVVEDQRAQRDLAVDSRVVLSGAGQWSRRAHSLASRLAGLAPVERPWAGCHTPRPVGSTGVWRACIGRSRNFFLSSQALPHSLRRVPISAWGGKSWTGRDELNGTMVRKFAMQSLSKYTGLVGQCRLAMCRS